MENSGINVLVSHLGEYIYLKEFCSKSHFKQNHSLSLHSSLYYSHSLTENIKAYTIGPPSYRAVVIRLKLRGYNQTTRLYEGWNFNSGNYLFTTDTK